MTLRDKQPQWQARCEFPVARIRRVACKLQDDVGGQGLWTGEIEVKWPWLEKRYGLQDCPTLGRCARYDLETARVVLDGDRHTHVLFCCQQALEKALKALIVMKTGEH